MGGSIWTSIRDQIADYLKFKWQGIMTPFGDDKLLGAHGDQCCEVYNWENEEIVFKNIHPLKHKMYFFGKTPEYWDTLVCGPNEWLLLPHSTYLPTTKSGKPPKVTVNFGDQMGKGNKLPSRPEVAKVRSFVPRGN